MFFIKTLSNCSQNKESGLLALSVAIASHKFLYAPSAVNDLLLSSVKWVSECADFNVHNIALYAINDTSFVRFSGRDTGPLVLAINIEHRINIWVRTGFHKFGPVEMIPNFCDRCKYLGLHFYLLRADGTL